MLHWDDGMIPQRVMPPHVTSSVHTTTMDDQPPPVVQVTAYADGNPDFPGACGRCYEVRHFE